MELEQLYRRARRQHGALNRDVVHDLYVQFNSDLPSDAYVTTCMRHARPLPAQEMFEVQHLEVADDHEQQSIEVTRMLHRAIERVRKRSEEMEMYVDTFLECCVNGSFKSFSAHSGISISVLRKICSFTQKQIRDEYNRIS